MNDQRILQFQTGSYQSKRDNATARVLVAQLSRLVTQPHVDQIPLLLAINLVFDLPSTVRIRTESLGFVSLCWRDRGRNRYLYANKQKAGIRKEVYVCTRHNITSESIQKSIAKLAEYFQIDPETNITEAVLQ